MKWEKIGITILGKPSSHGGGLVVRIPKKVCDAYGLYTADVVEVEIRRARQPEERETSE